MTEDEDWEPSRLAARADDAGTNRTFAPDTSLLTLQLISHIT
jgi:hypothetical protein